jgi:hypothetical protein
MNHNVTLRDEGISFTARFSVGCDLDWELLPSGRLLCRKQKRIFLLGRLLAPEQIGEEE